MGILSWGKCFTPFYKIQSFILSFNEKLHSKFFIFILTFSLKFSILEDLPKKYYLKIGHFVHWVICSSPKRLITFFC
jgi:hypothetical protein